MKPTLIIKGILKIEIAFYFRTLDSLKKHCDECDFVVSSDNDEDSSCGEEDGGDNDDLMGAEESGEEDKKELCIQVKLAKEEKSKPSLDR